MGFHTFGRETPNINDRMQLNEIATVPYRRLLDTIPDGVVCFQAMRTDGLLTDFRIAFVNQIARSLSDQYIIKIQVGTCLLADHAHLPALASVLTYYFDLQKEAIETGQPVAVTRWLERLKRWYAFQFEPVGDDLIMAVYRDVTEAIDMTRQRDEQNRLQQGILDASINSIIAYGAIRNNAGEVVDFRFLQYNEVARRYLSLPPDVLKRTMLELFPGSMQDGIMSRYVRVVETGEPVRFRTDYQADGLQGVCFDISVVKMDDGIVLTFLDVTAEEVGRYQLNEHARQLQLILDGAINSVVSFRAVREAGVIVDFVYESLNQSALGYLQATDKAQFLGQRLLELNPGIRHTGGIFDMYVNCLASQQVQRHTVNVDGGDNELWLDLSIVPISADQLVVSFMDTTTIMQNQRQLETTVDELRKSNANLEQFAYIASHDMQEPLRKINAFGGVLMDQYAPQLGEEGSDMIRRMQSATIRMQVLIDDLLLYSRLGNQKKPFKPVNLTALLTDVLLDLDEAIRQKNAVVNTAVLPTLPGDETQLRQLLLNLLSNALKFTQPSRPPVVSITCQWLTLKATQQQLPGATHSGGYYCLRIQDNGIGFDPKYTDRIMQMFQRLHGRNEYPGTGIGLAIVQKVTENHRGYIRAESEPGKGASFFVYLPIG